uniref:Uncharacterized protein n=1 Tax=Kalanchoe fedtschenkoi TaxID=63787 RepID=A0A7N0SVM6_KALFE
MICCNPFQSCIRWINIFVLCAFGRYTDDMELDDAVHTAILTLKEGFEGQISGKNIEIGIIGADRKFRVLTSAEVDDYLAEVE